MDNEALFRDKPVWTAILSLAVPSVLITLIMVVYNIADMYFIAKLGDDSQVAAVSIAGPVFSMATAAATTIGAGGCAVIAKALGAGEREKAEIMSSLCVWAAILLGAVFTTMCCTMTDPILGLLGATEDMMDHARIYMRVLSLGTPLMLFSMTMGSTIRAEGIILPGMISNLAGTAVNLILDPLFILGLNLGVAGAAAATVLGNLVSSVILIFEIRQHSSIIRFSPRYAAKAPLLLLQIAVIGFPNGISGVLSGLASTFSNRLLNLYGTGAIASMAAAGRAVLVITMVQMGICMGVSPLLAYNYGAQNVPRVRETLQKTTILTSIFGFASAAVCYMGREALINLFLQNAANAELGQCLMLWLIAASPLLGLYYLGSNFLQAAGRAFEAAAISLLRQGVLLIPCLYLMHYWLGLTGIAIAHTIADVTSAMIAGAIALWQFHRLQTTGI